MGSVPPAPLPAPSNGETYRAVEVQWSTPQAVQVSCPAASFSAGPVKRGQARCLRMFQNVPTSGSVDLRGAKYGKIYAWVPQGAQAPRVYLGRTEPKAQFLATDSMARVCDGHYDCNVIWVPLSVDLKVDYADYALAEFSFVASEPSETYPGVDFALFENITLAYPASPGSPTSEGSTRTGSGADATQSPFSTSSNPLVPISIATGSGDATSSLTSTSQPAPSDVLRKYPSKGMLVGITVSITTLSAIFLSLFLRRRRKRRRQDTSYPDAASDVAPFPIAAPPSIPEYPSDSDGDSGARNDKVSAALNKMPKSSSNPADSSPSGSLPTIKPAESPQLSVDGISASPTISPVPASPRQVAQLTAVLYRAGLSVNELMNSLDRVSRLQIDVNHDSSQRTTDIEPEVLPPRYEA